MFINHQSPMISSVSLGLLLGLLPLIFCGQPPPPKYIERYDADWQSLDRRPLPEWYDDAKIGIFIHWGVYSVPSFGSEWFWYNWRSLNATKFVSFMARNYPPGFTYGDFAHDFTAEFFNPDEWSSLFVDAGARYVVVTSKHHDGYALWPSSYSFQWNSMAIGPKRNLLRELCESTRKHGLRFGLYHSLYEWFNPLYLMDKRNGFRTQKFVHTKILPEMYELINKFQPEIFWSDGEWEAPDTYWNSTEFIQWLYNDSPVRDTVVVNDRWGSNTLCKHGGYFTCKDRFDPGALQRRKWENAMTLDRHSWGYRRVANLTDYLTIDELIVTLVKTVSCGGNLLINVGPTKYGRITPIFEERLRQLGEWLKVNGEAIYETQPWSHQNDSNLMNNVWYTQSKNDSHKVYAIQCGYPTDDEGIIQLNDVDYDQIHTVRLLGTKKPVHFAPSHLRSTLIEFPRLTPNDPLRYAYAFEIVFKQK